MITSSSLYLASIAATMLQADAVVQSHDIPSLCMKPTTGEWILVNPINPTGPALGYGILPAEILNDPSRSAEDCMPALPDNLKSWLEFVEDAKAYIAENPKAAVTEHERIAMAPAQAVEPIMPNIKWDQGSPYNKMVPSGCPTGCVATALSQIMYFYHYPEQGQGSHSYEWKGTTHSVNFADYSYDWDLMFDSYNAVEHDEENINEVAKLNYHVGVAMDMMYAPGGSGAYDSRVNERMRDYFGYNPYGTVVNRFCFGLETWTSMLNRELALGHPVYMSGSSSEAGHAFVLDGVNTQGYYHVNWGWGGYYNGWFDISIMKPEGVGTGASPSDDGFAWNQCLYLGFTPEVPADSIYYTTLQTYYIDAAMDDECNIVSNIWLLNAASTTQKGTVWFELMKDDEVIDRQQVMEDDSYRYWKEAGKEVKYITPDNLEDGDYRLRISFCNREGLWSQIHGYRPCPDYIKLNVEDGAFTVWTDELDVKMTATEWEHGELYAGQEHTISVLIRNDGEEKVAGLWYLVLVYENGERQEIEATNIVTIAPQESEWVVFKPTFQARGNCTAMIGVFRQSEDDYNVWEVKESVKELQILDDGTFGADLSLTNALSLHSGDCEVNGTINICASIQNTAEAYSGDLELKIFADKNLSTQVMSAAISYEIGEGASEDVLLPIKLDKAKAKRSYYASVFMRRGNQFVQIPGEDNKLKIIVAEEGHAAGIESIQADPVTTIRHDLFGRPLRDGGQSGFEIRNGEMIVHTQK